MHAILSCPQALRGNSLDVWKVTKTPLMKSLLKILLKFILDGAPVVRSTSSTLLFAFQTTETTFALATIMTPNPMKNKQLQLCKLAIWNLRAVLSRTKYLRSVTATVSIEFTFSSGIKAVAPTHATTSAAATASSATTTASHRPFTNGSTEKGKEILDYISSKAQESLPIRSS